MIFIESVEVCAIKGSIVADGSCVFTSKAVIYYGKEEFFEDQKGHTLLQIQPLAECDQTMKALKKLNKSNIFISDSTYFYAGGGCC